MKELGIWAGRKAKWLGLRGLVQRSEFVALLRNEKLTTGKQLTTRLNTIRQEDGETVTNRQVG
jgi:hypothetical protein